MKLLRHVDLQRIISHHNFVILLRLYFKGLFVNNFFLFARLIYYTKWIIEQHSGEINTY